MSTVRVLVVGVHGQGANAKKSDILQFRVGKVNHIPIMINHEMWPLYQKMMLINDSSLYIYILSTLCSTKLKLD